MTTAERHELISLLDTVSYEPGQTIISEGESFQFLWILLSGRCQVIKHRKSGGEQEFSTLEPHGVFGEMSFFSPAPHSASVRAITAVNVGRLSREKYDMLLRAGSMAAYKLAFNVVGVLTERLRRMDDWAGELVEKNNAPAQTEEWRDFQSKLYSGWQF